jgi:tRNA C32,U32 (ribose-2'-O)-methylase TrmJ
MERERLVAHARETLTRIGYRVEDPHFEGALQRILRSQALQSRDARIVHKVLKHLDVLHPPGS